MPLPTELTQEDFDATDRFADTALRPQRLRLAECLQTLTGAQPSLVAQALERPTPWTALLSFLAASGAPWRGHLDSREAHEALAYEGWLEDPRRGFEDQHGVAIDTPSSIVDVLSLLSDPQGIITAEALVRQRWSAQAPQADAGPVEIRWRVVDVRRWRSSYLGAGWPEWLTTATAGRSEAAEVLSRRALTRCVPRLGMAAHDVAFLVRLARRRPTDSFATLLRELWTLGYGLHDVDSEGVIHLVAPRV